ncbi:MAG: GNAT family N-acetyltransferase [Flavobacteriaceae bacterium]|jgi:N-acetylglutamate synthase-like GNAT family acetyltransferase|nr:GNAT family N-acetyltransferase [Flavobacteriaceae bacterium]
MKYNIREANKNDMQKVLELIKELAKFEKELDQVELNVTDLIEDSFNKSLFKTFIAEQNQTIIGAAIIYYRYSTWKGKSMHLEDLIITKEKRNCGVGTLLLSQIINYARKENIKRVSWEVINWNENAIEFYLNKGAKIKKDWSIVHLDENGIKNYK